MDGSVQPLRDRGLIPAATPRSRTKRDQGRGTFDLNPQGQSPSPSREDGEDGSGEEKLPVGQAPPSEAGKRLDVTA